jgi:hypothetical protein
VWKSCGVEAEIEKDAETRQIRAKNNKGATSSLTPRPNLRPPVTTPAGYGAK